MKKIIIKADGKRVVGFYGNNVLIASAKDDKGQIPFKIFAIAGDALKGYEIVPYAIAKGYGADIQAVHKEACKALAKWFVYHCGYGHHSDKQIDVAFWVDKIKFNTKQSVRLINNDDNQEFAERLKGGAR